ncbi:MAG TPA: condensation domain-containing protein, partial [Thermoanaerobaculia bacterium]|nr:condensation domain-containing protein [Thermoanaerobaculia bacterium]
MALCGGEAMPPALAASLRQRTRALWNVYGPTETTVGSTVAEVGEGGITIGRPIANTAVYVLDAWGQPAPVGVPGELLIGGAGLARGYLDRPELTAERFVPDPFGMGSRLYRTGDLARFLPDGCLECLGRIDHQVKVRGFRIELGEIEAELCRHPEVAAAVVMAREDRLVAYVVGEAPIEDLREDLKSRLPAYMAPSVYVRLEALPLTPNGKVDRKALPEPEAGTAPEGLTAAPRTPGEELLAGIWCDVLRLERVGVHQDFFELGGHSLLATQVVSRVRDVFGVEMPLRWLFETPTVGGLAARLAGERSDETGRTPLRPVPRDGALPLSFSQERLWFLDRLEGGGPAYNIFAAVRLAGRLDAVRLRDAFQGLVRRHESLRTRFAETGGSPAQVIAPVLEVGLPLVDLAGLGPEEREAEVKARAHTEARWRFDLAAGPLVRLSLLRLGEEEHALLLNVHHIVPDAWSMGVLIQDLAALYEGSTPLPDLPVQYADFAVWQRERLHGKALGDRIAWWREELAGAPAVLDLPADRPRPVVHSQRGGAVGVRVPAGVVAGLRGAGRRAGATPFMALLSGFQILLARYTGKADAPVGSPIAGRTRSELEGLIGFFVNTLVLRTDLSGDPTFSETLARAREATLGAYGHQDLPFEKLVEELAPRRDLSYSPLFQVMLVLQNAPQRAIELPRLSIEPLRAETGTAKFDLTLSLAETAEGLAGWLEYDLDLFDPATSERIAGHFGTLLEGAAADPGRRLSELPLLSEAEREQLVVDLNATGREVPEVCVHEGIAAQATRTPDAVAVTFGTASLTYRELDRRANALAHRLRGLGVGPEARVGIALERSLEMVVGVLAVLKAGGAYVPLDPFYPAERLAFMREDSGIALVLEDGLGEVG